MSRESDAWRAALGRYSYTVNLASFQNRRLFASKWFPANLYLGDRAGTANFEARFRKEGKNHLEAWYEVVFWKMYSQKGRRDDRTNKIINRVVEKKTKAPELWEACALFVKEFSKKPFETFQTLLIRSKAMPVVATFPAFMNPDDFPMVDSRIVRWVDRFLDASSGSRTFPPLIRLTRNAGTIYTHQWDFYENWVSWCRRYAKALAEETNCHWRARDVEMAAFQNADEEKLLEPIT